MTSEWTNLDDIRECLDRFAASENYPIAMVLSGDWGTGKTHLWRETLDRNEELAKPSYAYVSLFGINSLDDLKYQLFQVLERRKKDSEEAEPGWWQKNVTDRKLAKQIDRLSGEEKSLFGKLAYLSKLPYINKIEPLVCGISFNYIRETIVCIDDFERKGAGLRVIDVLGLVSLLRENRNSKVILILNEDTLSDGDKKEFKRLNEKVFDWGIILKPSPEHTVSCVIPDDDSQFQLWKDTAIILKANNIRIIRRAYEFVKMLRERYPEVTEPLHQQFVNSMLFFCFSMYGKDGKYPSLQELRDVGLWSFLSRDDEDESEESKAHKELIQAMNWVSTDEVDLELIRFLEQGYLSQVPLDRAIENKEAQLANNEAEQAIQDAWRIYHDSFKDNADELSEAVYNACLGALKIVTPYSLDQSIRILRDLGCEELANDLADRFVTENAEDRARLDIDGSAFGDEMSDEYFLGKLRDALLDVPEEKNLHEVLARLGKERGWGGSDEEYLDEIAIEEVVEILENYEGEDLSTMLKGATQFAHISNASERIIRIAEKMTAALEQIAAMNELNARRLKRFGIRPKGNE